MSVPQAKLLCCDGLNGKILISLQTTNHDFFNSVKNASSDTPLTIQIMFKHKIVHNSFTLIKMYSSGHMNLDHNEIFFAILQAITDATLLASRAARITSILNQKQSLSDVSMQSVSEPMEH